MALFWRATSRDATRSLSILERAPKHIDELYSSGYSNLTYFDVEQRRLDVAADLLELSIPMMAENDPADLPRVATRFAGETATARG
jgi:hypothetical protein